jgi:hypothetical protein
VPFDTGYPLKYVIGIDLVLSGLSSILALQKYYDTGFSYVKELKTDYLVANSLHAPVTYPNGTRILVNQSDNERIAIAEKILVEKCQFTSTVYQKTCYVASTILSMTHFSVGKSTWVIVVGCFSIPQRIAECITHFLQMTIICSK